MKRLVVISIAAVVLLAGVGIGAFFYLNSGKVFETAAPGMPVTRKAEAAISAAGAKGDQGSELRRLVERLGVVQDRVVRGDQSALTEQGRLLVAISELLRKFKKRDWENYANVRSAFIYVLSGGDYGVLKPVADNDTLYEADRTIAQGIILFAQGKTSAARKLLSDVDPRALDVSLVGPFALARGSFYINHDNAKAIALFDEARLACPHTAIEEAAARREIPLLIDGGDIPRSIVMMGDYLRRFGNSVYAGKLFRDFSAAAAKRDDFEGSDAIGKLTAGTSSADKQARIDFYLAMAAEALPRGRIVLAKAAASAALSLKPESMEEIDRATLYQAAAEAPTTRAGNALNALHQVAVDRLSDGDSDIHGAAGYIASTVTKVRSAGRSGAPAASGENPARPPELTRFANSVDSADAALKEADSVMSGNVK
jgi:chemotaxis protein MotC